MLRDGLVLRGRNGIKAADTPITSINNDRNRPEPWSYLVVVAPISTPSFSYTTSSGSHNSILFPSMSKM